MKRDVKGLSIFSRLLIAFVGVVMIMSGILTAVFYVFSRRSVEKQAEDYVQQQFQTISYHFRTELRNTLVKDLQLLASNPLLDEYLMSSEAERDVNARGLERLFLESLKTGREYQSITFVDAVGRERVKVDWSGRVRTYRNVSSRPLFKRISSESPGSIDIEGPFADRFGNVLISVAIYKTDADIGKFGGAVIIDYSLEEFFRYLDRLKILDENPLWLFSPDGKVLKQPRERGAGFDPRAYLAKELQPEPVFQMVREGMLMYQDLSVIPDRPLLRLAVTIPSSLLLRDVQPVLRFVFIVLLCSLLFISVVAYYLSRYLSRPIIELARAASRVARGERQAVVTSGGTAEAQLLVESFNRMTEDLEKTTVSRDYVDNIIKSMMDTLIVLSPEGRIIRLNQAACALLGYRETELIGKPFDSIIADETGAEPGISGLIEKQTIVMREISYYARDGRKVPVLFSASVMYDAQANVEGFVCVAQDITERKRAEAQLRSYSEELTEINDELRNFAYLVSHDLRSPLVNIKGFSDELFHSIREIRPLLEKHVQDFDEARRRKYGDILDKDIPQALQFIGSSVNRMDNLIGAVLKLSRAGRRKLNPEPLRTEALIRTILQSFAHQIETGGVTVVVGELPDLVADRTAMEQIFANLLDNAVKYLDRGRPGRIEVTAETRGSEAVFHVSDNGRGMVQEDIPKAFDLFRRLGRQDVPGEGMGLAFVKTLVRLLGGRIWCESEAGAGATFSFALPLVSGEAGDEALRHRTE